MAGTSETPVGAGGTASAGAGAGPGGAGGADVGGAMGTGGTAGDDAGDAGDAPRPLDPARVCSGDAGVRYCDLMVEADGLDEFEGLIVTLHVGSPAGRRGSGQTRVVGGKFSMHWPQVMDLGAIYQQLAVLFDTDGDGRCAAGEQYLRFLSLSCLASGPNVFVIRPQGGSSGFFLRVADDTYCGTSFNLFQSCPADDGGAL